MSRKVSSGGVLGTAAAAWLLFAVAGQAQDAKPEDIYQRLLPSIITLRVETKDGKQVQGSACLTVKDGVAATAWHVVAGAERVVARFSDEQEFDVSGVVDRDEERDVALIRVKVYSRPLANLATGEPRVGSKAYVIGAPKGLEFSISDGLVSQVRSIEGTKFIQFTCPASPGNSGGPLVNGNGDVIGVVSWQRRDGQNLSFAVPVEYILALDASLPTQPWHSLAHSPRPVGKAGAGPETTDRVLADGVLCYLDTQVVFAVVDRTMRTPLYRNRFRLFGGWAQVQTIRGVPALMYAHQRSLQDCMSNVDALSLSGDRKQIATWLVSELSRDREALGYFTQAMEMAVTAGSWIPAANNLAARGNGILAGRQPLPVDTIGRLCTNSEAFRNALPTHVMQAMRLAVDESGFTLGVLCFVRAPLEFVVVSKGSMAESIGIRPGDRVVSVSGVRPDTVQAFKMAIRANLGKRLAAVIIRDGKERHVDLRIPKQIPKGALYKP